MATVWSLDNDQMTMQLNMHQSILKRPMFRSGTVGLFRHTVRPLGQQHCRLVTLYVKIKVSLQECATFPAGRFPRFSPTAIKRQKTCQVEPT